MSKLTDREVMDAFQSGDVFEASDATLDEYLRHLAVRGDWQTNQTLIINTIQTDRFIKKANRRNNFFTVIIVILSAVAIGVSVWSVYRQTASTQQMNELIELERQQVELLKRGEK